MMRDCVAPRLRALGWKGSGQRYEFPDTHAWVQLGFQKSQHNSARVVQFTINVSVIGRLAWDAHRAEQPLLPARPNPSMSYGPHLSPVRIGRLTPREQDTWWHISVDRPRDRLDWIANGVCASVSDYAMPEIRRLLAELDS